AQMIMTNAHRAQWKETTHFDGDLVLLRRNTYMQLDATTITGILHVASTWILDESFVHKTQLAHGRLGPSSCVSALELRKISAQICVRIQKPADYYSLLW